jgi:hypothetical protein
MFGFEVRKIDFDRIDSIKFILAKIDFKLKWFIFRYIRAKVSRTKELSVKINSKIRSHDL